MPSNSDFPLGVLPATGAIGGAILANDTGHPLQDKLRGGLKGLATGGGAAIGASLGNRLTGNPIVGGLLGGGLGLLGSHHALPSGSNHNIALEEAEDAGEGVRQQLVNELTKINPLDERATDLPSVYARAADYVRRPTKFVSPLTQIMDKMSAYGIPSREDMGDHTQLPLDLVDYIKNRHLAARAGPHTDFRISLPNDAGLLSWATKKPFPQPGGRTALFQQPVHSVDQLHFEGEIPSGYGKGTVKREDSGKLLITKNTPEALHFTTSSNRNPQRYALIKPRDPNSRRWLMVNTTPTENLGIEKPKFTSIDADKIEPTLQALSSDSTVTPKIDGASALYQILKDKIEATSYRRSKDTGRDINYTEKAFSGRPEIKSPKSLVNTVMKGELYGEDPEGKAIPPAHLSGLLNSNIANSLEKQRQKNIKLKTLMFDIARKGGQDIDPIKTPYPERLKMLQDVLSQVQIPGASIPSKEPTNNPTLANTPEEALAMWRKIKGGNSPLTREGIVINKPGRRPIKAKVSNDYNVRINDFTPATGRYANNAIGALSYSDPNDPEQKILGNVGTGFDDETRREIFNNFDAYKGRLARISSQEQFPSKSYRAPAFIGWNEDIDQIPIKTSSSHDKKIAVGRKEVWSFDSGERNWIKEGANLVEMSLRMWKRNRDDGHVSTNRRNEVVWLSEKEARENQDKRISNMGSNDSALLSAQSRQLPQLWRQRNNGMSKMAGQLCEFLHGYGGPSTSECDNRQNRCKWELRTEQLPMGNTEAECEKFAKNSPINIEGSNENLGGLGRSIQSQTRLDSRPTRRWVDSRGGFNNTSPLMEEKNPEQSDLITINSNSNIAPTQIPISPVSKNRELINQLIAAKAYSDTRNYSMKNSILTDLLSRYPDQFRINSYKDGVVGITHDKTRFRIHTMLQHVPDVVKAKGIIPDEQPIKRRIINQQDLV